MMQDERSKRDKLLKTLSPEEVDKVEPLTEKELCAALERGTRERAQATRRWYVKTPDVRF